MELNGSSVVVTGASRGLGLGLAQALVERGARVTSVARSAAVAEGVTDVIADATDPAAARRIVGETAPQILVLNAGSPPPMERIDRVSWADFSANWNVDTRAALTWVQAALTVPMAPGGLVVLVSSGAAVQGSPLSGGYAGAKRALWFMADYAQKLSDTTGLGLTFRIMVPRQMFPGTGTGDAGIVGYAAAAGVSYDEQAKGWPVFPPLDYGRQVADWLAQDDRPARVYGIRGDSGIAVIE